MSPTGSTPSSGWASPMPSGSAWSRMLLRRVNRFQTAPADGAQKRLSPAGEPSLPRTPSVLPMIPGRTTTTSSLFIAVSISFPVCPMDQRWHGMRPDATGSVKDRASPGRRPRSPDGSGLGRSPGDPPRGPTRGPRPSSAREVAQVRRARGRRGAALRRARVSPRAARLPGTGRSTPGPGAGLGEHDRHRREAAPASPRPSATTAGRT